MRCYCNQIESRLQQETGGIFLAFAHLTSDTTSFSTNPLPQGAHAFMNSGRIPVSDLGAFINLESTGPGGYDTMIQHKGEPLL